VEAHSLVIPAPPLPLHATEARNANIDLDYCVTGAPASGTEALSFCGPVHRADDFGVAHFEVGGAICGGLGGDLGCKAPQFVPAAAIEAEEGESVGGGIERHRQGSAVRTGISMVLCGYGTFYFATIRLDRFSLSRIALRARLQRATTSL
jgi:hypothetical protein